MNALEGIVPPSHLVKIDRHRISKAKTFGSQLRSLHLRQNIRMQAEWVRVEIVFAEETTDPTYGSIDMQVRRRLSVTLGNILEYRSHSGDVIDSIGVGRSKGPNRKSDFVTLAVCFLETV